MQDAHPSGSASSTSSAYRSRARWSRVSVPPLTGHVDYAALHVGGVGEDVGEAHVVERAVPERLQVAVEVGADAADLALGDARCRAERLDQVVDLASADAVDPGPHDHRVQGPVDAAPPLQKAREERA